MVLSVHQVQLVLQESKDLPASKEQSVQEEILDLLAKSELLAVLANPASLAHLGKSDLEV